LKLSPLLAEYLFANKKLTIPGVGVFLAKSAGTSQEQPSPNGKGTNPVTVEFTANTSQKSDPELIEYIAKQTGKMKSLAESDLGSYAELAREFLFTGKPFHFEGIGSLTRNKNGEFHFAQGQWMPEKNKELHSGSNEPVITEDPAYSYETILTPAKSSGPSVKRIIVGISVLAGLALAVWGGYAIYKKASAPEQVSNTVSTGSNEKSEEQQTVPVTKDTTAPASSGLVTEKAAPAKPDNVYRFIVKEGSYPTALRRYTFLKEECLLNVHMYTPDSTRYRVYFELPALPSDTTRIKDSLNFLYISPGQRKIWIE